MISIVLTTMNYLDVTKNCIESLYANTKVPFNLIVVDASDTRETVEYLESRISECDTIRLDSRYWIAYAWNRGIERAIENGADYICVINNDIEFTPGWLRQLLDIFKITVPMPVGIVGPAVFHKRGNYESPRPNPRGGKIYPTLMLMGCAFVISRKAIRSVGLIDERFINSHDEVEYCSRMWDRGFMVMCNTLSTVIHLGGTVRQENTISKTYQRINKQYNLGVLHPYDNWGILWKERGHNAARKAQVVIDQWNRYY